MLVELRIPGKLMLTGEYAVLWGEEAVATCVDSYLYITVRASAAAYEIDSDRLGVLTFSSLAELPSHLTEQLLLLVIAAVQCAMPDLGPIKLRVRSQLDSRLGVGSSSALILGVLWGVTLLAARLADRPLGSDALDAVARWASRVQNSFQGMASGYDVWTQRVGGTVRFQMDRVPRAVPEVFGERLNGLVRLYGAEAGAPTPATIRAVWKWLSSERRQSLGLLSQRLTKALLSFLGSGSSADYFALLAANLEQRNFFCHSPGGLPELERSLQDIAGFGTKWGYKTSGAGGTDALVVFCGSGHSDALDASLMRLGWRCVECELGVAGIKAHISAAGPALDDDLASSLGVDFGKL